MKKLLLILLFILFSIVYTAENKGNYLKYSLEKNIDLNYLIKDYNENEKEARKNILQDTFLKFEGKQEKLEYKFNYSDKDELKEENIYSVKYDKLELGDIKLKDNFTLKYFKKTEKIFGLKYGTGRNYIYGNYIEGEYKVKTFSGGINQNEIQINPNNYLENRFYKINGKLGDIKKVYFDDLDKTNNEDTIKINEKYYDEYKEGVDYILYENYIELLEPKKGDLLLQNKMGEIIDNKMYKKMYNTGIEDYGNYEIKILDEYEENIDFEYKVDKKRNLFNIISLGEEISDKYKIKINYYYNLNFINIGSAEEQTIQAYLDGKKMKKNEDYFYGEGVISFPDNLFLDGKEIKIFYKEKSEQIRQEYVLNLNYNILNMRYELSKQNKNRIDNFGFYIVEKPWHIEIGKKIDDPNEDGEEDLLKFEYAKETIIENIPEEFIYSEGVVIQKEDEIQKNDLGNIKINYNQNFRIRKKMDMDLSDKNILKFDFFDDNILEKLIVKIGEKNEDFDEDGLLDDEDGNSDGYLSNGEDVGINLDENRIGKSDKFLNTEDFNNNGILDKEDNYIYYEIDLSKYEFGWNNIKLNLKEFSEIGNIDYENIEILEIEGIKEGEEIAESYFYLSDLKFEGDKFEIENIKYDFSDELDLYLINKEEKGYFKKDLNSKINNYKTLEIEVLAYEETNVKIELNGKEKIENIITGKKKIRINISDLEKLYDIKILTNKNLIIKSMKLKDKIVKKDEFYYLSHEKKGNEIFYEKYRDFIEYGMRNIDKKSKFNYNLNKKKNDIWEEKLYFSTNIKKRLNFKYYYINKNMMNRYYSIFYFEDNKNIEFRRNLEDIKAIWEMNIDKMRIEGEVKKEDKSKKVELKNRYLYSKKDLKVNYNFEYNDLVKNDLKINKKWKKNKIDLSYKNKENYINKMIEYQREIINALWIGAKINEEKEYSKKEMEKYLPIINYKYDNQNQKSFKFYLENQLKSKELNAELEVFYNIIRVNVKYKKEDYEESLEAKNLIFYKEFEGKITYKKYINYNTINLRISNKYLYKEYIELKPYIKYEKYNNFMEEYNSYNQYEGGIEMKISI